MTFAIFTLIAWLTICTFMLQPKYFNKTENALSYLIITVIILSLFSIIYRNLKLIQYNYELQKVFSLFIYRDIIFPLGLLCYSNSFAVPRTKWSKIVVSFVALLVLYFIEGLTVWTGVRQFNGLVGYYNLLTVPVFMMFTVLLGKVLKMIK